MPETYNVNTFTTLGDLKLLAQRTATEISTVKATAASAIKYVSTSGNTVSFFTSSDGTGTAAFTVDFPKEIFLDNARTQFVNNFTFSAATYPGATNPSLDGKPVFVLAVRGTTDPAEGTASDTISYSFMDMSSLVDTYTVKAGASQQVITIAGYEVEIKFDTTLTSSANGLGVAVSAAANNAITKQADGLHVDISSKADQDTDAVEGNIAVFDANGNPVDSGVTFATDAEVEEALNTALGISNSQSLTLIVSGSPD